MLKKTIVFEDLDGKPLTDDFYFNLSKGEIIEMELSFEGGFGEHLKNMAIDEKPNGALIISTFKDILVRSVGRRSEDGRRFIKSEDITNDFLQSDAYSVFLMELATNAEAGAEFVNAVMPKSLREQANDVQLPAVAAPEKPMVPAWKSEGRMPTSKELQSMSPDELREAWAAKEQG